MKFFNKRSRLSDLGIPLHTGIKPFPFKLCIEKHRTAETLKPETRNFRPIRKQLLSRKKIASSQKNTCLCIGSGSGTGASALRPDASFPEPTRRAPAVRKRNPGQRPPREKRQTSPELAPQSNRSYDGGGMKEGASAIRTLPPYDPESARHRLRCVAPRLFTDVRSSPTRGNSGRC